MNTVELNRQSVQASLDEKRSIEYRRRLGQFATPYHLASEIISGGIALLGDRNIKFLEPAFGTGSFFSALLSSDRSENVESAIGVESLLKAPPICLSAIPHMCGITILIEK